MKNLLQTTWKGLLPLLIVALLGNLAIAQNQIMYEPTQPCTTDSITLTYGNLALPPVNNLIVEWYFYNSANPSTPAQYGQTVTVQLPTVGDWDVWYNVYDSVNPNQWNFIDSGWAVIYVDSICADNIISGTVFNDANGNGAQDGGEGGLAGRTVSLQPGNFYTLTDANGDYEMQVRPGAYTVGFTGPLYYQVTTPPLPSTYAVTFSNSGGTSTDNDFGLYALQNVSDLRVAINSTVVRPGFNAYHWISYSNQGTTTETGVELTFQLPAELTFDNSNPAATSQSGNTFTYSLGTLNPGDHGIIGITSSAPTIPTINLGDTVISYASIEPLAGDTTPNDNLDTLTQVVVGSYDPNDKTAFPTGADEAGTILPVKTLRYLIRFQNTGTFMAEDVRVEDTLVSELDFVSLRTLDASHTFSYSLDPATQSITWYFNDIMLPDSNADEANSHGFISFEVDVIDWDQLPNGTEINNTAYIYFDFNPAIITNTTRTTFDKTTGILETKVQAISRLYPNPASETATIEFNSQGRIYSIRVMDISGKEVINTPETTSTHTELEVRQLNSGLYLYEIVSEGQPLSRGKFMVK